jgi:hypothetical protein
MKVVQKRWWIIALTMGALFSVLLAAGLSHAYAAERTTSIERPVDRDAIVKR